MVAVPATSPESAYTDQAARLADQHHVTIPLADQPLVFLNTVWQAVPADHLVGLGASTCYPDHGVWAETVTSHWQWRGNVGTGDITWAEQMNRAPYALPGMGGIYWYGASRKHSVLNRFAARGSLDELLVVGSFWCDLDCAKHNYPLDRGLAALLSMPLPPTIVVFSGGGLQAVHGLSQPWSVINREAAQEHKAYSLALYAELYKHTGLELDTSVHEAARMMRLPGFINRKPERHGAAARIVYFDPQALYTPDQIRASVTLPTRPMSLARLFTPLGNTPKDAYQVGQEFVHYLVDKQPQPPERHPVILRLAMQAARAGMPAPDFMARIRPVAREWYRAEPHRAEGELDRMVAWAYEQTSEDGEITPSGAWLVRLTPDGFAQASEDEHDALRDKTLPTDAPPAPAEQTRTVQEVRAEQVKRIRDYANAKIKGLATYMLVRTPPGAGKTHAALQIGYEFALKQKDTGRGKVAILSQFTIDEGGWQEWLRNFGITDVNKAMYIVGRNGDPRSAGYCALASIADGVAAKGHNAVHLVCKRCPHQTQCQASWYLSQFKRAEKKAMVLARHQHGVIDLLIGYRRFLVFDESPLGVIGGCIELAPKDLILTAPVGVQTLYPELVTLLNKLMEALRNIVSGSAPLIGYPANENVKLGGRWLFDHLIMALGADLLDQITTLGIKPVQQAGQPGFFTLTLEGVANLPQNFLFDLWGVLKYEYEHHFLADKAHWNSRIIVWGQTLRIYPMRPFAFDPLTKIVVTDATGQPELYVKAFYDSRTSKPREAYIYEAPLRPHAHITQWVNSGNSRTTMLRKGKAVEIEDTEGQKLTIEADNTALARAKAQIKLLAERHNKSLLVVCYMTLHDKLRKWAASAEVLDPELIQYYGNLRGRNDYKHLEAVLLIGEPRIPPMEVFAQAQVWYWEDDLPIDFELDTAGLKLEPYPGYVDSEGKGRAYAYPGYRDERLNRMYVWAIQAEMRQCYERIRCNAPEIDPATGQPQAKYVYIAAQMPCSDHVDELLHWSQWETDQAGRARYEAQIAAGKAVTQAEYIEAVQAYETNYQRAQDSYIRVEAALIKEGKVEKAGIEKTKLQTVIDWLQEDPARQQLSIRQIAGMTEVARKTVERAKSLLSRNEP